MPRTSTFSDGMTEELISKLSKIGDLSVIARTSIMKYKGTDKSIAEIGRELQRRHDPRGQRAQGRRPGCGSPPS